MYGSMKIRVGTIRDGTQGVSLSMGGTLIGEWTDSRAGAIQLREDLKVAICRKNGEEIYLFSVPGNVLSGEQISENEVSITFEAG
jgi:hypothetical protein